MIRRKNTREDQNSIKRIAVIGAGAWGTAIACLIARNNHQVFIASNDRLAVEEINHKHRSSRLNNIALSKTIVATTSIWQAVYDADFVFIVVPSDAVTKVLNGIARIQIARNAVLVLCSKGIDKKTGQLFSKIIESKLPGKSYAVMSGPNFASEVAGDLPTITTIASTNKTAAKKIVDLLRNQRFLPIISNDVVTTQIAGTVKNILAIGCGIIDGLQLGENAKAALVTKGIYEMGLLAKKFGGNPIELISPAGFGDLFLTCSAAKSRNNSLGIRIGKGENPQEILNNKNQIYEGASSAQIIAKLASKYKIKLPICSTIAKILYSRNSGLDIKTLICRAIFE